jgi:two-component system, NtrC family, C4-dicarboxylate transport sensor histidine kinase DctB
MWLRTILENHDVVVEIEDNGVGIPDSIVNHIIEPFFTTKRSSKGMGLGLKICENLLRKMGGYVEMRQRQPGGSIFRVRLPIRKEVG